MATEHERQRIRFDPATGVADVVLTDVLLDGYLHVRSLHAERIPAGADGRPPLLRVTRLEASVSDESLTAFILRRQGEKPPGDAHVERVTFLPGRIRVRARYRGLGLPVTVEADAVPTVSPEGGLSVALTEISGALGWVPVSTARLVARLARAQSRLAGHLVIRDVDESSLHLALRLDGATCLVAIPEAVEITRGTLTLRCGGDAPDPSPGPLLTAEELLRPVGSGRRPEGSGRRPEPSSSSSLSSSSSSSPSPPPPSGFLSGLSSLVGRAASAVRAAATTPSPPTIEDLAAEGRLDELLARLDEASAPSGPPRTAREDAILVDVLLGPLALPTRALQLVTEALARHSDDPGLLVRKALVRAALERPDEAMGLLEGHADEALARGDAAAAARYLTAAADLALDGRHDVSRADAATRRLAAVPGAAADVERIRGTLASIDGDAVSARRHLEAALAARPLDPAALRTLAGVLVSDRCPSQARRVWASLLLVRPGDGEALRRLGAAPAAPGPDGEGFQALDGARILRLLANDDLAPEGAACVAAARLVEALGAVVPWVTADGTSPPPRAQTLDPMADLTAVRAVAAARGLLPEHGPLDLYRLPEPAGPVAAGTGWLAVPTGLVQAAGADALVFHTVREAARTFRAHPRLRTDPWVPAVLTLLARRVAGEGVRPTGGERLLDGMVTARVGRADETPEHDEDLDVWLPAAARTDVRAACREFVACHGTPREVALVLSAREDALDRVALAALGSVVRAAQALTAPVLTEAERARARRVGLALVLHEALTTDPERPGLRDAVRRLGGLLRAARTPGILDD